MSCSENCTAPELNVSPELYITMAPKATKQMPTTKVLIKPMLKSKIACFVLNSLDLSFCFSKAQSDCQIETSSGAGIHPKKAIRNPTSTVPFGIIWIKL